MGKYDKYQTGLLLNIKCVEKTVSEEVIYFLLV